MAILGMPSFLFAVNLSLDAIAQKYIFSGQQTTLFADHVRLRLALMIRRGFYQTWAAVPFTMPTKSAWHALVMTPW